MTSIDVERILDLMDQGHINREVLLPQDHARETFRLPSITARNYQEFEYLITSYMQHHYLETGEGKRSRASCFGEAKHILDQAFNKDPYQDGYNQAMQMGIDGSKGGMRMVLNEITEVLKRRALQHHMDHIFHHHVDARSKAHNLALSRAFFRRFGTILRRFGYEVDENTFAWNSRAALEYHRQVLEHIFGIVKKI